MDATGRAVLPLFTVFVGLWFLLFHLRVATERFTPLMRWIALAAALTAVGLLLYTGREVSVVQARPIWFSYGYPLVMFISAISALLALLSWPCISIAIAANCWRKGRW